MARAGRVKTCLASHARALTIGMALLYSLWLVYKSFGVFVGSLRADELHFIQNAWMAYKGHEATIYAPPLYHYLIRGFWVLAGGDLRYLYILRLINFALYCLQGALVYRLLAVTFSGVKSRYRLPILVVVVFSFLELLASFRGYEIRPEALGNTFLLLAFVWIVGEQKISGRLSLALFLAICISLVVASTLSFRLSMPAACLWLAMVAPIVLADELGSREKIRVLLLATTASVVVLLLIVVFIFDLAEIVQRLGQYTAGASRMDLFQRFTVNTWPLYLAETILALIAIGWVATRAQTADRAAISVRVVHLFVALALAMFYLFLFVWDVDPRGYIHSIEWVLMFGLFLYSVKIGRISAGASEKLLLCLFAETLVLSINAAGDLSTTRNTAYFLDKLRAESSLRSMTKLDTPALLERFGWDASLPEQINARRAFCDRYRGSLVITANINFHPICLVDFGTYDFSGWGNSPVDLLSLPSDQSLIVLAANSKTVESLTSRYGDRIKKIGQMVIIQRR